MRTRVLFVLVIVVLALNLIHSSGSPDVASSDASDEWLTFHHDDERSGFSPSSGPVTNDTHWIFTTGEDTGEIRHGSSPIVADGKLYFGSGDGNVYCLNASTGVLIWNFTTGDMVTSGSGSPAVSEGRLFVGSRDKTFYCLNASSGALVWSNTTSNIILSSPLVHDGKVFIGLDNAAFALNVTSGTTVWRYDTNSLVMGTPAFADGRIIGGSDDKFYYCLNASTGTLLWAYNTSMPGDWGVRSIPALDDGRAFIGMWDGLRCLNASTGTLLWAYTEDYDNSSARANYGSPAVAYGRVFISFRPTGFSPPGLYCFNQTNGVMMWNHTSDDYVARSSPVIADGKVYVGLTYTVYCFDVFTGNVLWKYRTGSLPTSDFIIYLQGSPCIAAGKVYVKAGDGRLYAFGPRPTLSIEPVFYDNTGMALIQPTSWAIRFPNDTVRTVSSSVTFNQTQAGNYSIVSIEWQGRDVVPETQPSLFVVEDILWTPAIKCRLPTYLTIALSTSASFPGFNVAIEGELVDYQNMSISDALVLLEYSVTGGIPWSVITADYTDVNGRYSAVWIPSATGYYIIRATWAGNTTHPGGNATVNLAVTAYEEQYVFSVTSNSSVSSFAFNSTSRELSFTVSGQSGTTGYVKVAIAKDLIDNITDLTVYFDDVTIDYMASSSDDTWLLYFTYPHTTHAIRIRLGAVYSPPFYPIVWNDVTYVSHIDTNSTVTNLTFIQSNKELRFNVTGEPGTHGVCNITIPKVLLGEPYQVFLDGLLVTPMITANATHTNLYVEYTHSMHRIEIVGTTVIPEFPTQLAVLLLLLTLTLTALYTKRTAVMS